MSDKWITWAALIGITASLTACNSDNYQIKQEHNTDRRGMLNDRNVDQNRVNTNLPQGGSEEEKNYRKSPNIRPSDANGGNPNPIEEQGTPGTPAGPGMQGTPGTPAGPGMPGTPEAPGTPGASASTPQPSRIGPSHPHH
jgi:hypothetical protein